MTTAKSDRRLIRLGLPAVAVAAVVGVAGCGSGSTPAASGKTSPPVSAVAVTATGSVAPTATTATTATTAPAPVHSVTTSGATSGGASATAGNPYFPVVEGGTLVFKTSGTGAFATNNTVTWSFHNLLQTPEGITFSADISSPGLPSATFSYRLNPNGDLISLSAESSGTQIVANEGPNSNLLPLTEAQIAAGTPVVRHSQAVIGGVTYDNTVTITSEGSAQVTVPAGTFAAQKFAYRIQSARPGSAGGELDDQIWFVKGLGLVRSDNTDPAVPGATSSEQLVSYKVFKPQS